MRKVPADHIRLTWGKQQKGRYKQSPWFKRVQILAPLLPIPVGMFLLYKAIKSYNRSPPPSRPTRKMYSAGRCMLSPCISG